MRPTSSPSQPARPLPTNIEPRLRPTALHRPNPDSRSLNPQPRTSPLHPRTIVPSATWHFASVKKRPAVRGAWFPPRPRPGPPGNLANHPQASSTRLRQSTTVHTASDPCRSPKISHALPATPRSCRASVGAGEAGAAPGGGDREGTLRFFNRAKVHRIEHRIVGSAAGAPRCTALQVWPVMQNLPLIKISLEPCGVFNFGVARGWLRLYTASGSSGSPTSSIDPFPPSQRSVCVYTAV